MSILLPLSLQSLPLMPSFSPPMSLITTNPPTFRIPQLPLHILHRLPIPRILPNVITDLDRMLPMRTTQLDHNIHRHALLTIALSYKVVREISPDAETRREAGIQSGTTILNAAVNV